MSVHSLVGLQWRQSRTRARTVASHPSGTPSFLASKREKEKKKKKRRKGVKRDGDGRRGTTGVSFFQVGEAKIRLSKNGIFFILLLSGGGGGDGSVILLGTSTQYYSLVGS